MPRTERDTWIDEVFGTDELCEGDGLPRGCVPYLPSSVDDLLSMVELAQVDETDVDVGLGTGRAGCFVRLVTGARVLGIDPPPHPREVLADTGSRERDGDPRSPKQPGLPCSLAHDGKWGLSRGPRERARRPLRPNHRGRAKVRAIGTQEQFLEC